MAKDMTPLTQYINFDLIKNAISEMQQQKIELKNKLKALEKRQLQLKQLVSRKNQLEFTL